MYKKNSHKNKLKRFLINNYSLHNNNNNNKYCQLMRSKAPETSNTFLINKLFSFKITTQVQNLP